MPTSGLAHPTVAPVPASQPTSTAGGSATQGSGQSTFPAGFHTDDKALYLAIFLAPIVLGGRTARDPLEGEGAETIADATQALGIECERIDDDLLITARMKEW